MSPVDFLLTIIALLHLYSSNIGLKGFTYDGIENERKGTVNGSIGITFSLQNLLLRNGRYLVLSIS